MNFVNNSEAMSDGFLIKIATLVAKSNSKCGLPHIDFLLFIKEDRRRLTVFDKNCDFSRKVKLEVRLAAQGFEPGTHCNIRPAGEIKSSLTRGNT